MYIYNIGFEQRSNWDGSDITGGFNVGPSRTALESRSKLFEKTKC